MEDADLQFALKAVADKKSLEDAMKVFQEKADAFGDNFLQIDTDKITRPFVDMAEIMKDVEKSYRNQEKTLKELKYLQDPNMIKERLRLEKEIGKEREKLAKMEAKEYGRQNRGKVFGDAAKGFFGGRGIIGTALNMHQAANSEQTQQMAGAMGSMGAMAGPMAALAVAIPAAKEKIEEIKGKIIDLAGIASPAALEAYNIAMRDVSGVMGQSLVPVLNMFRDSVRLFGDFLANILPNTQEVTAALKPFSEAFKDLSADLRDAMQEIGPIVRDYLLFVIRALAHGLALLARGFSEAAKGIKSLASSLGLFLGVKGSGRRSSVGAAAQEANITGMEDYQRQLQLEAFKQPGQVTAEDMPNILDGIKVATDAIKSMMENFTMEKFKEAVTQGVRDALNSAPAKEAASTAAGVGGAMMNPGRTLFNAAGAAYRQAFGGSGR